MCERLDELLPALRRAIAAIDPSELGASESARAVERIAEAERVLAAGRTLMVGRVMQTKAWREQGYRTPAQWTASRTKGTLSQAITSVETAARLEVLPETRRQFVSGELSEFQAAEIAAAAEANPAAETGLLEAAAVGSAHGLRRECRQVRAAAQPDEDAAERIRKGRYLRHWSDADGAVRLDGRFAPDDGARLVACITARTDQLQAEARRSGQQERAEAHAADAIVGLVGGDDPGRAVVHVHVDAAALARGAVSPGETCEIDGVGPVPVAVARRLAAQGTVKLLERDGVDVTRVAHAGRTIPAHLRTALEARDRTCVVPGCDVRSGLEIDHVVPLADGGQTRLDNLVRLCRYHHAGKTHHGWRLVGRPGEWRWRRTGHNRGTSRPAARAP